MNKIEEIKKELERSLGYNFNNWGKGDLQMLKEIIEANDKVVKNLSLCVVASLPTTNEAKLKLKQAVENSFKDNEVVEKREYSLGFRHCYNWLKIEQMKSKG